MKLRNHLKNFFFGDDASGAEKLLFGDNPKKSNSIRDSIFGDKADDESNLENYRTNIHIAKQKILNLKKVKLQEKLLNFKDDHISYETLFKDCVQVFKEDEITFKAKWK